MAPIAELYWTLTQQPTYRDDMKLYSISEKTGYNPIMFLSYVKNDKTFCIFTYSDKTVYRILVNTILSISSLSAVTFTAKIPNISGYGLFLGYVIFILNLLIFLNGLIRSRYCSGLLPKTQGRALDVYAMEWFLAYFAGAVICAVGAEYFENIFIVILLRLVAILVFCFSVLPFFGDRITMILQKAGHE